MSQGILQLIFSTKLYEWKQYFLFTYIILKCRVDFFIFHIFCIFELLFWIILFVDFIFSHLLDIWTFRFLNNSIIGFNILTSFGFLNFRILHFSLLSFLLSILYYIYIYSLFGRTILKNTKKKLNSFYYYGKWNYFFV